MQVLGDPSSWGAETCCTALVQLVHVLRRTPGQSAKAQLLSSPKTAPLMHRASQLLPMARPKVCCALCLVEEAGHYVLITP